MHGKCQREPARRAASPTLTKLLASASTIGAIWRIWLNQMWACSLCCAQTLEGVCRNSRNVISRLWIRVHQIWAACTGVPVDWRVSFRLLISCSVAEIFSVKVWSRSQKAFLPPARGGNAWKTSEQIFQIAVISKYVSKSGWDPLSDLRD